MKNKNPMYFLIFLISLICVAGMYMLANRLMFYPIMAIYQVISLITLCLYMYLHMSRKAKLMRDKESLGVEEAIKREDKRIALEKAFVAVFFPFVVTVFCDYTYLLLLSDQEWFVALMNLFN